MANKEKSKSKKKLSKSLKANIGTAALVIAAIATLYYGGCINPALTGDSSEGIRYEVACNNYRDYLKDDSAVALCYADVESKKYLAFEMQDFQQAFTVTAAFALLAAAVAYRMGVNTEE